MKITKINLELCWKSFVEYGSSSESQKEAEKRAESFVKKENINVIKKENLRNVNYDGEGKGEYFGVIIYYYTGFIILNNSTKESSTQLNVKLKDKIIDTVLQASVGEIKEIVKREYEEFEKKLDKFVNETSKNSMFSLPHLIKLKNKILNK